MMNREMNQLLKWGLENSGSAQVNGTSDHDNAYEQPSQAPNSQVLDALFGGPSDAELMKDAMTIITSSDASVDDKVIAFDNIENLVESIDNANNLAPLSLWEPLIGQLHSPVGVLRKMAAWCIGTAVQNNSTAQRQAVDLRVVSLLIPLVLADPEITVRRKAVYALSSTVRNFQPGLDALMAVLSEGVPGDTTEAPVDAGDMEAVDAVMERLHTLALR